MNNDAVSQVVGTILMVAITIIVAAIIASFLFGTVGNVDKTRTVAATTERLKDNNIQVTYQGGPDTKSVQELIIYDDAEVVSSCVLEVKAGSSCVFPGASLKNKDHIRVVARFSDSDPQVILDTVV